MVGKCDDDGDPKYFCQDNADKCVFAIALRLEREAYVWVENGAFIEGDFIGIQ